MGHRTHLAGAVLLSAGLLSAAATAPALATAHHKGTKIATTHIKLGRVLANSKGRVMYLFAKDGHDVSHCNGSCATAWPRVTSASKPMPGDGISGKHLGRTAKHDQVTYYGHPLYYFSGDTKPRQDSGEGENSFFVVSTHGKAVKPKKHKKPTGPTLPTGPADIASDMAGGTTIVTNSADGHTLYELSTDSPPTFACTTAGNCTTHWPPLLTKGAPTASDLAVSAKLGTVKRTIGSTKVTQVTYNGYPVYEYSGDTASGQDNGQYAYDLSSYGYWHDLFPDGTPNPATHP